MKLSSDNTLQPSDSYKAPAIGAVASGTARTITSDGKPVIGFHGRRSAVLDAIGLALEK